MKLSDALRVQPGESIAFSGSGGKTSALITLARDLKEPIIATTTTHFGKEQIGFADHITYSPDIKNSKNFVVSIAPGITLIIEGPGVQNRVSGPPPELLEEIYHHARNQGINLLIEADGSRQRALKAPAAHEPVMPPFTDQAVVVAGLSGLDKPFSSQYVYRVDEYAKLSNLKDGEKITLDAVSRVLKDDLGGLKGIPKGARRVCLLNQADDVNLQARAKRLALELKSSYDSIVVTSLLENQTSKHNIKTQNGPTVEDKIHGVHEQVTGVLLAAGGSERMGRPKQLLSWKGTSLVRYIVTKILNSGVDHIIVVVGAFEDKVRQELSDLPVEIVFNPDWESGQSTSVQAGLSAIQNNSGSVIFFLVDQPYLSETLIRSMIERHVESLAPIVAPLVSGQRGNPVLFDRVTFGDFQSLQGDAGGRQLFSRYQVSWLEWHDEKVLLDIDTDEDYRRLLSDSK